MTAAYHGRGDRDAAGGRAALWIAAAVVVIATHGAAVWVALNWRLAATTASEPPAAIMIDLAPLAVAPAAAEPDVAPGLKIDPSQSPLSQAPPEDAKIATPTAVEPNVAEASPPTDSNPRTSPNLEMTALPLPQMDKAEVVLPPAPPPPNAVVAPKSAPVPPVVAPPKRIHPKVESPKPKRVDPAKPSKTANEARLRYASAPPKLAAQPSAVAAAPSSSASAAPSAALASWKSELLALLNRNKRYPAARRARGQPLSRSR